VTPALRNHSNPSKESVLEMIKRTFQSSSMPNFHRIIHHECPECHELRDDLVRFSRLDIPLEVVIYHRKDLPLLTPQARRYYLPAYLLHAVETGDLDIIQPLVFSLYTEDFDDETGRRYVDIFTTQEKRTICAFLKFASLQDYRVDVGEEYIAQARNIWCARTLLRKREGVRKR